ncbi:hypothetical protein Nepgr_019133 [Nepenthes gracilis]|uniref:Late embryogenesis abundant protein LEA-2 subgroup domain-containing protein n=1 Tax=Nepenthes gracilis TaxID=150966 RepID=A0AAD3XTS1_NEPGR|nr:hypothetical protein Nepgr_019133 [Nepenthes gracilis]
MEEKKMAELVGKPVLKKPPGYKDPITPSAAQIPPPVRKPVYPPSFYSTRAKKRRNCSRICCCCTCSLVLAIAIFIAVAGGLLYLWFTPQLPVFRLRPLEIDRFHVTSTKDATYLDSEMTVRVEVKNPNEKLTIYYGETTVSLTADGETNFGSSSFPGFSQGTKNVTILKFTMKVANEVIDDSTGKILSGRIKSKAMRIDAEAKTKIGVGAGSVKIGMLGVNVLCGDFSLQLLSYGDPPKCTINTLKW